ncbi:hypothetical protein EMIHUDRAFT_205346 [Emiliania huxleyi CCMP1516]|uniref:Uncharacterized protein n=2 Tax=Emiliania huxleyi TaxID=2903 RepID=A0A0D3JS65_EMIH1|nr:hypothetical protein EMIHUDRAFT_205346 [Emiliania huxleyi CCMP1516]EOD26350.1 hypothetical protein EMIHUDRAFT_205346 [Emiliania huxleyi CCMP1516]|eukprot:XP_005778779.1 hypothetical protein EMIHUDRAFT_205346 [Emiliania huxleyi CCMP1516]
MPSAVCRRPSAVGRRPSAVGRRRRRSGGERSPFARRALGVAAAIADSVLEAPVSSSMFRRGVSGSTQRDAARSLDVGPRPAKRAVPWGSYPWEGRSWSAGGPDRCTLTVVSMHQGWRTLDLHRLAREPPQSWPYFVKSALANLRYVRTANSNATRMRLRLFTPPFGPVLSSRHYAWWKVRVLQFIEEQHRSRSRGGGASAAQQQRRDGCAWALLLDADAFVRAPAGTDLLRRLMPLQLTAQQPDPQTLASGAAFAARLQSLAPAADLRAQTPGQIGETVSESHG